MDEVNPTKTFSRLKVTVDEQSIIVSVIFNRDENRKYLDEVLAEKGLFIDDENRARMCAFYAMSSIALFLASNADPNTNKSEFLKSLLGDVYHSAIDTFEISPKKGSQDQAK